MSENLNNEPPTIITLEKDQILCREKDQNSDLYLVDEGELMVYVTKNSRVTPLAKIKRNEFIGELSFFDGEPRSANIIALRKCKILCIPKHQIGNFFPAWLIVLSQFITKRIRLTDSVIQEKGIRRKKEPDEIRLSIEEEAYYYKITQNN